MSKDFHIHGSTCTGFMPQAIQVKMVINGPLVLFALHYLLFNYVFFLLIVFSDPDHILKICNQV